MERQLQQRDTPVISVGTSMLTKRSKSNNHSDDGIASRPQESQQVQVTFKQEAPTSRTVAAGIRAQELSPGPVVAAVLAATKSSSSTTSTTTTTTLPPILPPEVVAVPSDIMDSEFLHDEPAVNQTTSSASSTTSTTNGRKVSASAASANVSSTTSRSVLLQQIAPAGPTERSRIPTNSAVIFPSLKNKPGFTNSTFFYDYTTPQNIRVRNGGGGDLTESFCLGPDPILMIPRVVIKRANTTTRNHCSKKLFIRLLTGGVVGPPFFLLLLAIVKAKEFLGKPFSRVIYIDLRSLVKKKTKKGDFGLEREKRHTHTQAWKGKKAKFSIQVENVGNPLEPLQFGYIVS